MKRKDFVIKNINVVDVEKERIIKNIDLLIRDGKIEKISKNIIQNELKEINYKDKYLCPGLVNMHAHLFSTGKPSKKLTDGKKQQRTLKFLKTKLGDKVLNRIVKKSLLTELYSGTTTVRSVGDFNYADVKQRDLINEGKYLGPTLYCSGFAITAPTGHGDKTFAKSGVTKEDFEKLIDENIDADVDWIKICTTGGVMDAKKIGDCGSKKMSYDQAKWCVEYAHKKGFKVASHTEGSEGMVEGISLGIDTIEHGALVKDDEFTNKYLKEKNVNWNNSSLITTISPAIPFGKLSPKITMCDEVQKANADIVSEGIIEESRYALDHNIRVGLGTDASCPYAFQYGMWRELAYFVKYVGVKNSFALKTATIINASILGKEKEIGSIAKGKYFDAIILDKNPLDDVKVLRDPLLVYKHGFKVKHKNKKDEKYEYILDTLI